MEDWALPIVVLLLVLCLRLWAGSWSDLPVIIEQIFKFPLDIFTVSLAILTSIIISDGGSLETLFLLIVIILMIISRVLSIWAWKVFDRTDQGTIDKGSTLICALNYSMTIFILYVSLNFAGASNV